VAFDSDGTLSDTLPWLRSVYNGIAAGRGLRTFSEEDFERHRDLHGRALLEAAGVPRWKLPLLMRDFRNCMESHTGPLHPFPGIPESLRQLRAAGLRLAVVSSNSRSNVERILGPGVSVLFEAFECGSSLFGKASRLRSLLRRCAVGPQEAVYVGDEVRDAEAAREAGMRFAAVCWGQNRPETLREQEPEFLFCTVADIAPALVAASR
jgi:phosphoglycolate phosphatase